LKHTKFYVGSVLVGWAIYPLGYMMGTTGWYNGIVPAGNIDVATTLQMLSTKLVSIGDLHISC
jgi:hypothetical protein